MKVNTIKFLGLWLHQNLSWTSHIENLYKRLSPIVGVIYRLRNVLSTNYIR